MKSDYHMHTSFSKDCNIPMEKMIIKAISLNMEEICFTDHVDYGLEIKDNCDYPSYFLKLCELKEKYKDKITIKQGIEFGVQTHTIDKYVKDTNEYDFDFILLSVHQIDNLEFSNQAFQKNKTQEEINILYYKYLLKIVQSYKEYSVLAHLDVIKRYDKFGVYPDDKVMSIIDEILKTVIKDQKGIEVNTKSFKFGLNDLMPSTKILTRYNELGGKIVTIGSDAHHRARIYDNFENTIEQLKEIGFTHHCTFDKLKPIFHQL